MTIENAAAEIVEKLQELVSDSTLNAQDFIAQTIKNNLRGGASSCLWRHDDIHDKHDTECGEAMAFETGGIKENGYVFCPFCGGNILIPWTKVL